MTKRTQFLPSWSLHFSEFSWQRNKYVTYKLSCMIYKKSAGGYEKSQRGLGGGD